MLTYHHRSSPKSNFTRSSLECNVFGNYMFKIITIFLLGPINLLPLSCMLHFMSERIVRAETQYFLVKGVQSIVWSSNYCLYFLSWLPHVEMSFVSQESCNWFAFYYVLIWVNIGLFCPYLSGSLHRMSSPENRVHILWDVLRIWMPLWHLINLGYPAKRALSAMRKHGR